MELKYVDIKETRRRMQRSNRTFMELKLVFDDILKTCSVMF